MTAATWVVKLQVKLTDMDVSELSMCVTTLLSEFKEMREEFQTLKAVHDLPPSGAASSSVGAAASPTKGSGGDPVATYSGRGKGVSKKRRCKASSDEEDVYEPGTISDDEDASELVELSDATGAFMEAAFKTKLENPQRKKKLAKFGTPNCRWVQCPKLDPVVSANVSREAIRNHQSSS